MHAACFRLARFKEPQRLGYRYLIDKDLLFGQWRLRNAVASLDDSRFRRHRRRANAGSFYKKLADRDSVRRVIRTLVDNFEYVIRAKNRCGDLHSSGAPTIGHWHLAASERNLISGNRNRLQDGAADHPLCLLVEIREIIS